MVVGSSAGAYASVVWTPAVKEIFPQSMVRHFADCGVGVGDDAGAFPPQWNPAAAFPAWVPGLDPAKDDVAHLGLNAIYKLEAAHYPDVEFSQFNYNHDGIQSYFLKAAGGDERLWTLGLYLKIQDLVDHLPNFHSFIAEGKVHAVLLPLKVFFLLMVLSIGILLAVWRRKIDKLYGAYTGRIERGLLVGALAMLVWPVSNHGFLQSSTLLYGKAGEGLYAIISPVMSFMFAAWALLLVLFARRRRSC